jgi:hypothetical protein
VLEAQQREQVRQLALDLARGEPAVSKIAHLAAPAPERALAAERLGRGGKAMAVPGQEPGREREGARRGGGARGTGEARRRRGLGRQAEGRASGGVEHATDPPEGLPTIGSVKAPQTSFLGRAMVIRGAPWQQQA